MQNIKNILEASLYYIEKGFSVIPVGADKTPLIQWKEYQNKRATPEQVKEWLEKYPAMNIAIVTGKISGIVVVDIEEGGSSEGYHPTVMAKTGGNGIHLYYKHPGYEVPNGARIKELTDIRGDGGYVLAPPSVSNKGEYEWQISLEDSDLSDWPVEITKKASLKEDSNKKWLSAKDGVSKGSRNDTAASMAGKIISCTSTELLESIGWEQLKIWNSKNTPPLLETELRKTWESIKKYNEDKTRDNIKLSPANLLLESIFNRKDIVLFHDEQDDGYISLDVGGHQMIKPCRSKSLKKWLSNEIYHSQKKAPGTEVIKSILDVLEGRACYEGPEIKLQNRASWHKGDLWYDLTNDKWEAVQINKDGWNIINKPPIIFKRFPHNKTQVIPTRNGEVSLFLNYINITNPEHKLLFLVFLVSCFIPDFPHVMLVVFGAQGSSKSTLSKLARLVVDPSAIEVASLPNSQKELIQAFAHHYFLFFDNISHISEEESDTLCKAITGGGHIKRELYQNDEDIIYKFMRCIGINGINLVTTRPDLLERSLLLELERIDPGERKTEKELYDKFNKDLPSILGGIFDVLVKAIQIHPTIKLTSHNRMADWTLWGCAIAEGLGYTKEEFLDAYNHNIVRQTEMLLNENIVATALFSFMEYEDEWKGTPTDLLDKLSRQATFANIDTREKYWPKASNSLSRKLNELSTYLKQMGLLVTISTTGAEREIWVRKNNPKKTETVTTQKELLDEISRSDDTDDISSTLKKLTPIQKDKPF